MATGRTKPSSTYTSGTTRASEPWSSRLRAALATVAIVFVLPVGCGSESGGGGGPDSASGASAGDNGNTAAHGGAGGVAGQAATTLPSEGGTGADKVDGGASGAARGGGGGMGAAADSTACTLIASTSSSPCQPSQAFIGGKCVPCTNTGDACVAAGCADCCTRLGVAGVCTECTAAGDACKTPTGYDCCSHFAADGVCLAECTSFGKACVASDCSDCCAGRLGQLLGHHGVGADGACVECNTNADCPCPAACRNHTCACTEDGARCLSSNCSDCCSSEHAGGRCAATAPQCMRDDQCAPDEECINGECSSIPMAAGGGGG